MKFFATILIVISLCITSAFAKSSSTSSKSYSSKSYSTKSSSDVAVRSYTKKDGTTVSSYKRTNPNGSQKDNFSAKGNVNPYTGKVGTITSYK